MNDITKRKEMKMLERRNACAFFFKKKGGWFQCVRMHFSLCSSLNKNVTAYVCSIPEI